MADRYRLKDGPPGVECQLVELGSFQLPLGMCWVNLVEPTGAGAARMATFVDNLELIPPPLPEEPPEGTVIRVGDHGPIFMRYGSACGCIEDDPNRYLRIGHSERFTWEQVVALGTPVRLVADPFAEPVALPWSDDEGRMVGVTVGGPPVAIYAALNSQIQPATARLAARALWAAADQVESGQR